MGIGAIAYNHNNITKPLSNNSRVNNSQSDNFGNTLSSAAVQNQAGATKGIVLHGKNDADGGEEFAGSWADVQTGVSTSVYKPDDFSEDNPYYHVKIWKPDGTMEERMVDVINFNPKFADSFDHYAFTCYLEKEEGMSVQTSVLAQAAKTGDDLYQKRDWVQAYKDMMQQQYDVGYHEGYMRFKKMYERLMEQFMKVEL